MNTHPSDGRERLPLPPVSRGLLGSKSAGTVSSSVLGMCFLPRDLPSSRRWVCLHRPGAETKEMSTISLGRPGNHFLGGPRVNWGCGTLDIPGEACLGSLLIKGTLVKRLNATGPVSVCGWGRKPGGIARPPRKGNSPRLLTRQSLPRVILPLG